MKIEGDENIGLSIFKLYTEDNKVQDFLILKQFRFLGMDLLAIYPCDENQEAFEDGEYEFLYKDHEGNINFSDGNLYDAILQEYIKALQ